MPAILFVCLMLLVVGHPHFLSAQPNDSVRDSAPSSGTTSAPPPSKSSPPFLSLKDAIETGLAEHPLIARARATSKSAAAETKQAKGRQYPWLEASVAGGAGSIRVLSSDGANVHAAGDLGSSFRNRSGFHQYGGGRGFALAGALPKYNQNMTTGGLILNQLITDFGTTAHRILSSQASETATEKEILTNKALVILNVQQA
ncbi:MAG: TolC family protein, partial [Nitrospirae bacterium]|nr:TolC family protein [Nitrospirota bacterium]